MAQKRTTKAMKSDINSGLARIELFSTEVVEQLNHKWLPDEAGTSCLSLLNCVNGIIANWESLTEYEREQFDALQVWEESESEPDPIREYQDAIGKLEWLRGRLPEHLKRLHQPEELAAFLTELQVQDSSSLAKASPNQRAQRARHLDSRIVDGLLELREHLLQSGREHELIKGWEPTGWDDHEIGMQPVQVIPELISHLKGRAVLIRHMGALGEAVGSLGNGSDLLNDELQNARLAIREMNPDPSKWPTFDYDPHDFDRSLLQLEKLIDDLCKYQAQNAKVNKPPPNKDGDDQPPFGMKFDEMTKTVTRFNPGINKETFCTISNDEQWNLFMLVMKRSGRVAAKEVQVLLPLQTVRDRTVSRLRGRLQEIQLTIRHQKGTGYVLTEI